MDIVISGRLPEAVLENLAAKYGLCNILMHDAPNPMAYDVIVKEARHARALMCMLTDKIDRHLLDACPKLKIVATMAVGYDNIDVEYATQKGVLVTNTTGVLTDATADLAFALMLAVMRRIVEGDAMIRRDEFPMWSPFNFLGTQVTGKTLGIVGFGCIGQAVARRAQGFGMQILYNATNRTPERDALGQYAPLPDLLRDADVVSLHVPQTPETVYLINAEALKLMKSTAFLINTARGPVVNEQALYEALVNRQIAGAGLDVYEKEPALYPGLNALGNVVLMPHVGSATMETRVQMAEMCLKSISAVLQGKLPDNCLNQQVIAGL